MLKKILFIDRDGTLINEPKNNFQIDSINKISFEKNVILVLSQLKKLSYILVMVTNQDGLGTKKFPQNDFDITQNFMLNVFKSQNIIFDNIFICPHYISDNCICRKPNIIMLHEYLNNKLDKKNSYVIGDRITDMELAQNIGIHGIQYHRNKFNWLDILHKLTTIKRYSKIKKQTRETSIKIQVFLDNYGMSQINTGINFFNHMLEQIATHAGCIFYINVIGDLNIDDHHTIEDTALSLGEALFNALGNKLGINRFGFILPMDDTLAECAIDLSGRPYLHYYVNFKFQKVGDLSTEMIKHFFYSLSYSMNANIYLKAYGENDHHKAESLFKIFGQTLKQAIKIIHSNIPSSKGILY
ncbi:bifunctional histidinol-phosphatase/imidazoleglycerol-phosphate dehydratase HisB [Enterobacteriaceae endosymbiont of Neohaemonia nigricornis]|uniref:bifunctional histidinol-phosphatase/imidazoleglycerol-phosphate dehydratase HisB n=1 Tax=Enterobacteriaceae endosymbiont of Neohaemonia nigricornis TaxID=2675792 RepID=UPI001449A962|nr:bifunctional histidinol-phosphatase/imidazoleglycerol-phosphate dehydratase HisB [Enterobacteriaceae endosymbiont of Neohaemonia nigricornis]QJC30325.1 bifunctional histidinol-phosphatase/imidazoleglycerol-phosphate dehydratase HisB [Enterobacteriaceae endosymbiont of Neohaemonia nigricornis]